MMQFYKPGDQKGAYGVREYWYDALDAEGANQMKYLKNLIIENDFFEHRHDQSALVSKQGIRYDYVMISRGKGVSLVYTYTGAPFTLDMKKVSSKRVTATWFDPRIGVSMYIGTFSEKGTLTFNPPGHAAPGNDWVLVLKEE